jgi:hypothetical protein
LEVGAGTRLQRGAAGIVGSRGRVTSIEIDFELALKRAGRFARPAIAASIVVGDGRDGIRMRRLMSGSS